MNRIQKHAAPVGWSPKFNIDVDAAAALRDRLASCLRPPPPLTWNDVGRMCVRIYQDARLLDGCDVELVRARLAEAATSVKCAARFDSYAQACFAMQRSGCDDVSKMSRKLSADTSDGGDSVDPKAFAAWIHDGGVVLNLGGSARAGDVLAAADGYVKDMQGPSSPTGNDNPGSDDGTGDPSALSLNVKLGAEYGDRSATVTFSAREVKNFDRNRAQYNRDARGRTRDGDLDELARIRARSAIINANEKDPVLLARKLARQGVRLIHKGK